MRIPDEKLIVDSWRLHDGILSTKVFESWFYTLSRAVSVDIRKTTLSDTKWFYDSAVGQIVNTNRTFFQISGIRSETIEHPVLLQEEIGLLGMLCKPIKGLMHFLVNAKIEPGNVNRMQVSPTIQATKSNFTQTHGGAKPRYLDWFLNASKGIYIVDQIQSEQSSRFFGKRNRNIIIMLDENTAVEESPTHMWLTLGQIKKLMRIDNFVNMDTRTVLSCIPFYKYDFGSLDTPLIRSIVAGEQSDILPRIYHFINECKMFNASKPELVHLYSLSNWETEKHDGIEEFVCKAYYPFKVVFCDISIEGREVRHWGQPLFEALGNATFGLFTRVFNGVREFLVHAKQEVGCFDKIELGPTVQLESTEKPSNDIERLFFERYSANLHVQYDVVLSEEGGRFYHEQNKNIIIEVEPDIIPNPPPGYWWCTYRTLCKLVQINNILNIQLRNLLSLLEIDS